MSQSDSSPRPDAPPEALATAFPGSATPSARKPLGLVVPTVVLAAFWIVTETSYQIEMGMFYRFLTRMVTLLIMLLFFLIWGFTRRHFSFLQRLFAFSIIVGTAAAAGTLAHESTGIPMMVMMGMPITLTLGILWLWATRKTSFRTEITGIAVASIAIFGTLALLRWDGMDGRQRPVFSWRWNPSSEEQFQRQGATQIVVSSEDQKPLEESAGDWSSFRGGDHESIVNDVELADWAKSPPKEIWRKRVGPGWSSIIAVGDFLFTQEQRGNQEAVVCYEAKSGDEVWVNSPTEVHDRFEEHLSGTGPRATPTFHENRIYAFGAKGQLTCLNATTGQPVWTQSLFSLTNRKAPQWGSASSPLVVDDKVVVFVGAENGKALLAFDRTTGEQRWQAPGGATSYSSPQVMTICGQRMIIMHDDQGLNGVAIDDGKVLWKHESPHAASFQPMIQPHLLADDRLLVNWDSGMICLKLQRSDDQWKIEEQWSSNRLKPSFNDFVVYENHIYGLDDGIFCCFDVENHQRVWKRGRYGFGQLLLLPKMKEVLVLTETGDVVRVALDPKELREIGRFKAIEGKTWNHPLLAHDRLVVRNGEEIACFDLTLPVTTATTDQ